MGNNLFNANISGQIAKALGPLVLPATLIKVTDGTRTPGSLTGGTNPTSASSTCRGFTDDYRDSQIDGTIIMLGDRKVILLGDTIVPAAVPTTGDQVTIESRTYIVIGVTRDPDAATYNLHVR